MIVAFRIAALFMHFVGAIIALLFSEAFWNAKTIHMFTGTLVRANRNLQIFRVSFFFFFSWVWWRGGKSQLEPPYGELDDLFKHKGSFFFETGRAGAFIGVCVKC